VKIGSLLLLYSLLWACHNTSNPGVGNDVPKISAQRGIKIDSSLPLHVYPDEIDEQNLLKAEVSRRDSSFSVFENIRRDYRIFGYQRPDTNSKRMILFSVFTRDVDQNPYDCPYGSFYQSSSMENSEIKYQSVVGPFVATELYVDGRKVADLYFEKKWIEFTD